MSNNFKKIRDCNKGFSLTEVLVGMMILTVAIVTATNLVVGIMKSNKTNVMSLQAYYLAVEGIEGVRNIRDTNWLLNQDWLEGSNGEPWGAEFAEGGGYIVNLNMDTGFYDGETDLTSASQMADYAPWLVAAHNEADEVPEINIIEDESGIYMSANYNAFGEATSSGFYRTVSISPYVGCENEADKIACRDYVIVTCMVSWKEGNKEKNVTLNEVLTDWKGGVL